MPLMTARIAIDNDPSAVPDI
eukprot:SAG11_NODE_14124_length_624_cov_0.904762_2_plen_20_part_01